MKSPKSRSKVVKKKHIIFSGNRRIIVATREAIGAMKYKAE